MHLLSAFSVLLSWSMVWAAALPMQDANGISNTAADSLSTLAPADLSKRGTFGAHATVLPDGTVQALDWTVNNARDGYIYVDYFIAIAANGDVRFHTHFRNSNDFFKQKYALVCAFRDSVPGQPAHVFSLSRGGSLGGDKETTSSPEEENRNNPLIAQYWQNIIAGDRTITCEVKGEFDLGALVDKILQAIKDYGPIIGEIIAIF